MKNGIAILVLISYMLCALGFSFSMHYCGGDFKYLTIQDDGHEVKCCKGQKEMPEGCCKSNKITFKKSDDQPQNYLTVAVKEIEKEGSLQINTDYKYSAASIILSENPVVHFKPPPDRTASLPLYILHSVYRI